MRPWLRQIEVRIGPLPEWRGSELVSGPAQSQAIRLFGDGSNSGLRIRFSIRKHIVSTSTPSMVSVYNLSQELRNALRTTGMSITVRAGWLNDQLYDIFTGGIVSAYSHREGADIVTNIGCLTAWETRNDVVSMKFGPDSTLEELVKAFALRFRGVRVEDANIDIQGDIGVGGTRGTVFYGRLEDGLDKYGRAYGYSWRIQDGVFYAQMDKNPKASQKVAVVVSSSNGFLMRAEPLLAGPWQQLSGVSIYSLFNPLINPGTVVRLESAINPSLNNGYLAQTVNHSGDTHSNTWNTESETLIVNS